MTTRTEAERAEALRVYNEKAAAHIARAKFLAGAPAFPMPDNPQTGPYFGMDLRAYIAANAPPAPSGFESRSRAAIPGHRVGMPWETQAQWAVQYADELLRELTR